MLNNSALFLSAENDEKKGNYITITKIIEEHKDLLSLNPNEYSLVGSEYEVRNSQNEVVAIFEIAENGIGYNKTTGKPFVDQLADGIYKIKEIKPSKGFILDQEVYEVSLYSKAYLPKQITVNTVATLYGKDSNGQYFANNQYKLWATDYGIGVFECGICQTLAPIEIRNYGRNIISTATSKVLDKNSRANRLVYKVLYYGRRGPAMWSGFSSGKYHIPFSTRDDYNYYPTNGVEILSAFITHVVLGRVYGKNDKWQLSWPQDGVRDYYNWVINQPDPPEDFIVYVWENYQTKKTQDMFYGFMLQPTDYASADLILEAKTEFDPIRVVLTKTDKNDVKIPGAQFTVEYYNQKLLAVEDAANLQPVKKWVFETDERGIFRFASGYLVSGDELFIVDGNPILLAGTYIVSETKVPIGYVKADDFMIKVSSDVSKPVEFTDKSGTGRIETSLEEGYKLLELLEGYLTLEKESETNCNYSLANARYQLFTDEACLSAAYINNTNQKAILITDASGKTDTIALAPGKYYLKEIEAPENFHLDLNVYEVDITQQETVTIKSIETPKTISLKVIKIDVTNTPLSGVVFGLYNQNDELVIQKTTDEKGEILFENMLFVAEGYYLKEISAKKGYILDYQKHFIDTSNFTEVIEKEIVNYSIPQTGDIFIYPIIVLMIISFVGTTCLIKTRKKFK